MDAKEILLNNGYEDVVVFDNPSFDSALIGVTSDNRAVYDYDKMVEWFCEEENCSEEDAADFISYDTIRSLGYYGDDVPIVMFRIEV